MSLVQFEAMLYHTTPYRVSAGRREYGRMLHMLKEHTYLPTHPSHYAGFQANGLQQPLHSGALQLLVVEGTARREWVLSARDSRRSRAQVNSSVGRRNPKSLGYS